MGWWQHGIISFNWDLQAELILQKANLPWGYSPSSGVPIIKPHGSINWSGHRRDEFNSAHYPFWQPVGSDSRLSFDSKNPLSNPDESGINRNLNYVLFPGDSELPEFDEDVGMLWRDAACLVDRAKVVVFIGYSFPNYDTYARKFFKDRVQDKMVVAVNPSTDDLRKFRFILGANVELRQEKFRDCPYGQPALSD